MPLTPGRPGNFTTYPSTHFVESAGTVLFHRSTSQICLLHYLSADEYLLPKGRRNLDESRQQTAIRETREETGWSCSLPRVRMWTRCTPPTPAPASISGEDGGVDVEDVPRLNEAVCEPFMMSQRVLPGGKGLKIVWWYVGVIDEGTTKGNGEGMFEAELFGMEEAVGRLTFESDREVVRKAIEIFRATFVNQ
jgi:8-oxo-dGTP pyrophosphatase MutT (NUDIX family)